MKPCMMLDDARIVDDTLLIDLWYPRSSQVKAVELGLMDVRAADAIRISYDFDRDGWKIEQASTFQWGMEDEAQDSDWQEVAFVQAWARAVPGRWEDDDE